MNAPIVIVGSGLAGCSVVREVRKLDPQTPITLVCADDGAVYAKPTLSNALAQQRAPHAIASATAAQFAAQARIDVLAHTTVAAIDPAARGLDTDRGRIEFGSLVLALGARQAPLPGVQRIARLCSVNSLHDYHHFHGLLDGCGRVVVLGAGFIGCEFANDLRGAGYDVDVVDLAPHPLARFWPPALARVFETRLATSGIRWHLGTKVVSIAGEPHAPVVTLADGTVLQADLVVSALGLVPCTDLARAAGLCVGRGIQVDATLATSAAGIFALGDCAEIDGQVYPFVMPTLHSARALARTLTGTPTPVRFPPMPVTLKTPACPAVFLPAPAAAVGRWSIEDEESAVFESPEGAPLGVALLGAAVKRRDQWIQRIVSAQTVHV